jgi:hypothetical protein
MQRLIWSAAVTAACLWTGTAGAEVCFKLNPFRDVLRLEITGTSHHLVYGNWIAPGAYTLPVAGARELNTGSTTVRRIGITGTNAQTTGTDTDPPPFGGNLICGLDGIPGGAWKIQCTGKAKPFAASGPTMAPVNCNTLAPSSASAADAGRAVGQR